MSPTSIAGHPDHLHGGLAPHQALNQEPQACAAHSDEREDCDLDLEANPHLSASLPELLHRALTSPGLSLVATETLQQQSGNCCRHTSK